MISLRGAYRRLAPIQPVWGLTAVVTALAAALYFGWVRHYGPVHDAEIAWWVLALMVLVTERWSVELEFPRSSHSFSLTDIPVALALVFATGTHAFIALLAGTFGALLLHRLSPAKLVFNVAQLALASCVMIIVVQLASGLDPGFGWLTWGAVLVATPLGGVLTIIQILGGDDHHRRPSSRASQVRDMFGLDLLVTITGTALALVGGIPLDRRSPRRCRCCWSRS